MVKKSAITGSVIFILGLLVYWSTSYPSITWWETSEYAGAAVGLGISGPPGSLLLTIAGWILSKLTQHDRQPSPRLRQPKQDLQDIKTR